MALLLRTDFSAEPLQPGVRDSLACLRVTDSEPDASEPMRYEHEHED